ncbi:MAG: histidinol dehydrogenase [Actinomycetia bacterium]|nr:histidinol dehydrogenase [Actinomycetes bacterium]
MTRLQRIKADEMLRDRRSPVDAATLHGAAVIVEDVRSRGEAAVREYSERFGDLSPADPIVRDQRHLNTALDRVDSSIRELLERVAGRIEAFAREQRSCLLDLNTTVDGGRAGHRWLPVDTTGAYAPGGRYPLPSSVLMTVIPARVAGVDEVWVASPRPTLVTLAAAAVAGADGLLAIGGAQAIAALTFGTFSPPSDVVVGPGNRWVTAAKKHLYGEIGIDGLAGPSEIVVVADGTADPRLVAADLLAQAEHDPDALPILVTDTPSLVEDVELMLDDQLATLPTAGVAKSALDAGSVIVVASREEAVELCNRIAPEHLALHMDDSVAMAARFSSYGSLFVGSDSAEVFADYGAGPNHVLPTDGGARYQSGLSVTTFLKAPTWLALTDPAATAEDAASLARLEGLEAHARAAELRM